MSRQLRLKFIEIGAEKPCGTILRYMSGCRCFKCRCASANARKRAFDRQRAGQSDPLVLAARAVRHVRKLRKAGLGYRAVAEAAGVWPSTLQRIKNGEHRYIKRSSARRILAITPDAIADHGKVPADKAKRMVKRLMKEGFTRHELSKRIGLGKQFLRAPRTLAVIEMRIEKFYNKVTAA